MLLETPKNFPDFELIDTGDGYRLEKWDSVVLARPDPQVIWEKSTAGLWEKFSAKFIAGKGEEKGRWEIKGEIPKPWIVSFGDTKFLLKLSPFKHTGLFPEQAAQWEWMVNKLQVHNVHKVESKQPGKADDLELDNFTNFKTANKFRILNLFAYSGGATMVLAKMGCQVTHVDASKPSLTWANENYKLNFGSQIAPFDFAQDEHSPKGNVRWILDDAVKFIKREVKRGAKYDGIIMDPPAFGHSPTGKTWKFNNDLPGLLEACVKILSDDAKFLIINGYATNSSALAINNLLEDTIKNRPGKVEFGELCLKQISGRMISTGIFARWQSRL